MPVRSYHSSYLNSFPYLYLPKDMGVDLTLMQLGARVTRTDTEMVLKFPDFYMRDKAEVYLQSRGWIRMGKHELEMM